MDEDSTEEQKNAVHRSHIDQLCTEIIDDDSGIEEFERIEALHKASLTLFHLVPQFALDISMVQCIVDCVCNNIRCSANHARKWITNLEVLVSNNLVQFVKEFHLIVHGRSFEPLGLDIMLAHLATTLGQPLRAVERI
ncbi:hypothetical protein EC988_002800 [Linderina pennispora]|nr:hypothetical protein EC988_002800 [Linderina pennispora]